MGAGYLLHRVLLQFSGENFHEDLSTTVFQEPYLWIASDETTSIERLSQVNSWTFGEHRSFPLADFLEGFDPEQGEVDIEGIACSTHYLWVIGSHSTKRGKAKDNRPDGLKKVKQDKNRYLLARIPIANGELHQSYEGKRAAWLEPNEDGNSLLSALKQDEYLAPFLTTSISGQAVLPGKDNGLDIEGLVVQQKKLLIGFRGPVLRGIALLLEIELEEKKPGVLGLKPLDKNGSLYRKHFLDLDGLGIRELCLDEKHLLILAGPTMDLDGTLRLFRLQHPFDLPNNSFSRQREGELYPLFDVPYSRGADRAEGITIFPTLDQRKGMLVVYDSPNELRRVQASHVLADVFSLE